jgi:hypothetical protein
MTTAGVRRTVRSLALASLLWAIADGDTLAQPTSAVIDTFVAIVPRRPVEDITRDADRAKTLHAQAQVRLERAREEVRTLDIIIGVRQKDLESLEGHLDTLDSEKKAEEVAVVKQKIILLEKLLDLLELRKNAREGEAEAATATVAYAEAQEDYCTLEGTLETKRSERADLARKPGSTADLAIADRAIKELEAGVLERWEKSLSKHERCVSEEQDLLGLLRKLKEAQEAFHTP